MKRVFAFLTVLVFTMVGTAAFVMADGTPSTRKRQSWTAQQTFKNGAVIKNDYLEAKNGSGLSTFWRVDPKDGSHSFYDNAGTRRLFIEDDGDMYFMDASGVTDNYLPSDKIVIIDTLAELSTWTGISTDGSGSYFQTEAGKTYIVDMFAITNDGAAQQGTTAFGASNFSAVSAMLPLATAADHMKTVTVMWATTSDVASGSGTTEVQVWPAPYAGATAYRTGLGAFDTTTENASIMATSGSSVITVSLIAGSRGIDAYGESGTWMLFYNSAVSAQMIDRNLP
uniref:Uncharacterized protein n=1 Tax=viral metagenome TaxID=1070528 RepID=A0A6M3IG56_9ZZZZ